MSHKPSVYVDANLLAEEDEVMRRCRRVREELYGRFKTHDEMFAWLASREKQAGPRRGFRIAKAQARRPARHVARHGKPANGKPVHKP